MIELYIKVENGVVVDHPMHPSCVSSIYPGIDLQNLPPYVAKFHKKLRPCPPEISLFDIVSDTPTYKFVESEHAVYETWDVTPMPSELIEANIQQIKDDWEVSGFKNWTFNEKTYRFDPPHSPPNDGKNYAWNDDDLDWREIPPPDFNSDIAQLLVDTGLIDDTETAVKELVAEEPVVDSNVSKSTKTSSKKITSTK